MAQAKSKMDNSALSVQLRELIKTEGVDFDLLFPQPILADLFRELRTDKITIQDFEIFLLSLTASYFDLVNINKNRLAAISTAKKFANIAKAIATVKNEINALSDSERNVFLDRLNQINLPEYRRTEIRNILANDQKVAETDTRIEFVKGMGRPPMKGWCIWPAVLLRRSQSARCRANS